MDFNLNLNYPLERHTIITPKAGDAQAARDIREQLFVASDAVGSLYNLLLIRHEGLNDDIRRKIANAHGVAPDDAEHTLAGLSLVALSNFVLEMTVGLMQAGNVIVQQDGDPGVQRALEQVNVGLSNLQAMLSLGVELDLDRREGGDHAGKTTPAGEATPPKRMSVSDAFWAFLRWLSGYR